MDRARSILLVIAATILLAACATADAASARAARPTPSPTSVSPGQSPVPTTTSEFVPSPNFISGRIVRLTPRGFVVDTAGREAEVDVQLAVEVWKETVVPASALEVGDDVEVAGKAGTPFIARNVWADIAVVDGFIREIDGAGMDVEVHAVQGAVFVTRIDFSPYLVFGAAGITTTRADLVVGREVGCVVYWPHSGPLRATRVWSS